MKRRNPLLPAAAGQDILKFPVVFYRWYRIISSGSDFEIICINYKKKIVLCYFFSCKYRFYKKILKK